MPRASTLTTLAELAEEQWGLFTRRQAETTGLAWTSLARVAKDGVVERIAHGVYRLRGAPPADHLALRAAWLQLAPDLPAWERTADHGVISHRSAAALRGLGHLPADVHEFTLPVRRQSRRPDVRLHRGQLERPEWTMVGGLLVTTPARTAADLLAAREDPQAVGYVIADALRAGSENPANVVQAIAPRATAYGLGRSDGHALLEWLLDLTGDPGRAEWLDPARTTTQRTVERRSA